jgi:uncharacterized protein (TIGR00106 family)
VDAQKPRLNGNRGARSVLSRDPSVLTIHANSEDASMLTSFSIIPVGKSESLSEDVAEIFRLVSESGVDFKLGAMETTVEGEPDAVWALLRRCHERMRGRSTRVLTHITIDDREGASGRIDGKVASVRSRLGECKKGNPV